VVRQGQRTTVVREPGTDVDGRGVVTEPSAGYRVVERRIGLAGGTVLLLGTVVGASVFLLPGVLIGEAGPSIILALAATLVPMVLAVLALLQLGGAMPVAGGVYVYGSRLVGPFWGFLMLWLIVPMIWATLLFTSIGFAEFTRFFVDVPAEVLMAAVLVAFIFLNLRGVNIVARVQMVMVAVIVAGFAAFIVPGAFAVETGNYTPLFPRGVAPFVLAIVSLYIPFQGFAMIVELGEELHDPVRNIPRVLVLGMGTAVLLSLALVTVFVGLDDWEVLAGLGEGGVAEAAGEHLFPAVGAMVATAAVLGAFTTLNALITSYSRTLMRAARDGVISPRLAAVHPRTHVPHLAILTLSVPPLALIPVGFDAVVLSVFMALIILFAGFIVALALWNLPKRFPRAHATSVYRLPLPLLRVVAVGSAGSSVVFWSAVALEATAIVGVIVALGLLGGAWYTWQVRSHRMQGIDLRDRLLVLDEHETVAAGSESTPVDR
jgi:basic amino acid/polyamine antiporter, APA family